MDIILSSEQQKSPIKFAGIGPYFDERFGKILFNEARTYLSEIQNHDLVILQSDHLSSLAGMVLDPSLKMYAARPHEGSSFLARIWEITQEQYNATRQHSHRGLIFNPYKHGRASDTMHQGFNVRLDLVTDLYPSDIYLEDYTHDPFIIPKEKEIAQISLLAAELRESEGSFLYRKMPETEQQHFRGIER